MHVICSSYSSWSTPIIVVPKGDDGEHLMINCSALNKVKWTLVWPMPRVEDISKLNSAKYFSTFDLHAGYHNISLNEDSIPKTAFTSPFGKIWISKSSLCMGTTTSIFPELMNKVFQDLPHSIAYLSDIIIYSKTAEEHMDHLQQVFHKPHDAKLWNWVSVTLAKEIQYLGHVLSNTATKIQPSKTAAIKLINPPKMLNKC